MAKELKNFTFTNDETSITLTKEEFEEACCIAAMMGLELNDESIIHIATKSTGWKTE